MYRIVAFAAANIVGITAALVGTANGYDITADSIRHHISILADDSLEGRKVGEPGEWKAARYIVGVFETIGLEPKGDSDGYLQAFDFIKAIETGPDNRLAVNGITLALGEEFQPMRQSANGDFSFSNPVFVDYGISVDSADGDYDDYEGIAVDGRAVIVKRYTPSEDDYPDIDFSRYASLTNKITTAIDHGATGVFFITPEDHDDTLHTMGPVRVHPKDIPIVFLRRTALERLGLGLSEPSVEIAEGCVELTKVHDTGFNVVGYLPGATDTTVIIGAHYDHLGWGGEGSRYLGEEPKIHPGADDNASGVACLIELARHFAARPDIVHYSMAFAAFSGEEIGIVGSSHFVRNMPIDTAKARMMANIDMVGRLQEQEKGLAVMGVGSCPQFKDYFDSMSFEEFKISVKESGIGPSDHSAFYNRRIPVLFFFTGAHEDYHKPADVIEKIDFDGTAKVARFIAEVVGHFEQAGGELAFQKTKAPEGQRSYRNFSVTLGIMPDFISEVKGLRVDGVSLDRPGDRAGLKEGDVIIRMGDIDVGDIYDYMNALGKFRKGDSTEVIVVRDGAHLTLEVVFQ